MSFGQKACVVIICDGGCDQPWEDGTPHFESEAEATRYARSLEWVVTDTKAMCPTCARHVDCERTGHQWDDWRDNELGGVQFRKRWCDHCATTEYDPPFAELSPKLAAVREAERIVGDAAGTTGDGLEPGQ